MFSIVIPLFNKARFVEATIRSVQAQRFADFEVLIVDDGSTDGSGEIARHAIEGDERFRYLHTPNGGVSAARNRGAAHTTRPWLVFLDADDEWHADFLATVAEVLRSRPDAVIVSTNYEVRSPGALARAALPVAADQLTESPPFYDWALKWAPPVWTSATAVRRDDFAAVGGFDDSLVVGEDIHLWVRLLPRGAHLFVHRPLAVYERADLASLGRSANDKALASRLRLIEFLDAEVRGGRVPANYRDEFCKIHYAELLRVGRRREAWRFWRAHGGASPAWAARRWLASWRRARVPGEQLSWRGYVALLRADLYRHGGRRGVSHLLAQWLWGEGGNYSIWLRTCAWLRGAPLWLKLPLLPIAKWRHRASGFRLGISIPYATRIGPGLHIAHHGGIVVSHLAVLGRDCTISQGVTLGWKPGPRGGAPRIGNEVYIGPGAKVIGGITVGDGAVIGANAVVTADVPAGAVVAGIPARVIGQGRAHDYVVHRSTELQGSGVPEQA
jgi:serine O-acetyltransferase